MPSRKKPGRGEDKSGKVVRGEAEANLLFKIGQWTVLLHPLLLDQVERLVTAAEQERAKQRKNEEDGPNTKLVAAVRRLIFEEIPQDPSRPKYRHGGALGHELRHWFRAKFGNGRFRLFFRFRKDIRLLVFVWVNDSETLRTYGSRTDAYAVFQRMISSGNPPDDWEALTRPSASPEVLRRARRSFGPRTP